MKVLAVAAMSLALADPIYAQLTESGSASTATPVSAQLVKISRAGSRPPSQGSADNFTGAVRVDPLFRPMEPARAAGAYVTFEPGAHSAWHTHPLGQTLIVTAGVGRVQRWGDAVEEIRPGDVIWIPPGQKHWHGAATTSSMTHIAVGELLNGKSVDWLEKLTPAQYAVAPGRTAASGSGLHTAVTGALPSPQPR